jgi:hypothetical protein
MLAVLVYLLVVVRLRMNGSLSLLPQYVLMARTGTTALMSMTDLPLALPL